MRFKPYIRTASLLVALLAGPTLLYSQPLTLDDAIRSAKERSVLALEAKSSFVSSYWAWRAYEASRLPSLSLYGNLGSFDRSLRQLQNFETGELVYTSNYNMQNSIGIRASQNITLTGGTLSLSSDLNRLDQFNTHTHNWYVQPVTLSYVQPIFSYNRFKWEKLISPKDYEKARRSYLESMEDLTLKVVDSYFALMGAMLDYESARTNYANTSRMLNIAAERLSIGSVTRDEYLQLELSTLNDSISINDKYVLLRQAQLQFNSLLGLDATADCVPVVDGNLPDLYVDFDLVNSKARSNSSFNLTNEINILNAESAVAQAKADRGLTMALNARFGVSNSAEDFRLAYTNLLDQEVVGLSFTIPIFDWGMGKGRVKKAEAAADVIRAQAEQADNDFTISLFTAVGQFNNQRQQCGVSTRARDIAEERYSLVMEKFKAGNATVTDLNNARNENDSARRQFAADLGNYWKYYYTLRKMTLYDFLEGADIDVDYEEMVR